MWNFAGKVHLYIHFYSSSWIWLFWYQQFSGSLVAYFVLPIKCLNNPYFIFDFASFPLIVYTPNEWKRLRLRYFSKNMQLAHWLVIAVGYTMRDIRYKWNEGPNSVGVSNEVSLPQFKVLGHRQRAMEISLTTGIPFGTW